MDEMRLDFAERCEGLRFWTDECVDTLGEVVVADSVAEAEQQLGELGPGSGFEATLLAKRTELAQLAAFAATMAECGVVSNPYSRFTLGEMQTSLDEIDAALADRCGRLQAALDLQRELEQLKRRFASAAEAVLAHAAAEKVQLEAEAPAFTIQPGDAAALARGKQAVELLAARLTAEARAARAVALAPAEELAAELLRQGDLHNPFTHHTGPSLKSVLNQLEKLIRDRQQYVEAQLARAEVSISREQHAEIVAAFKHFDKNNNGGLDFKEFVAALQSVDLAIDDKEMKQAFEALATPAEEGGKEGAKGEAHIGQEDYITCVLKFYADSDTSDSLLDSFRLLAGGSEFVTAADVKGAMGEANAGPLLAALAPYETEQGYDYNALARRLYAQRAASPTPH